LLAADRLDRPDDARVGSQPNVQSTVTLVQSVLENGELLIVELRDEELRDPRKWTGAVSVKRATPASVSATTTPRASESALAPPEHGALPFHGFPSG
jgi:hypothetical protein